MEDQVKKCKKCAKEFTVEAEDFEFYKKMSPTFDGKVFDYPAPTLCPECREIRRLTWRNEKTVYKRKCDRTGKDIVSMYSPDKELTVYESAEWWKDDWDALSYGKDFDFSRPFFDQYLELAKSVPKSAMNNPRTEGCEYSNNCGDCKNCYLSSVIFYNSENTHYSYWVLTAKDSCDISFIYDCEKCYDLAIANDCYGCMYSGRLNNCRDCLFSFNLRNCQDCMFCTNLIGKKFCFENEQLSEEEYKKRLAGYEFGSRAELERCKKKYNQMMNGLIVKYANNINCENCSGDDLRNCKNAKYNYSSVDVENCKYSFGHEHSKNVYDCLGGTYEWVIEGINVGFGSYFWHCATVHHGHHVYYSQNCYSCQDCFGCEGLRNKKYCILNKQYTKEEYEKLAAKVVEHMQKTGEWGEFFPAEKSHFGYNEVIVNSYFPLTKDEAIKRGFKWKEDTNLIQYDGPFYEPLDNIAEYKDPGNQQEILSGVLKCSVSGKPFKIMPQELAFYLKNNVPVPTKHYDVRFEERFNRRNPRRLWHRTCMNEGCINEFETTYAPDRPEKVFCEECYLKEIG